MSTLPTDLPDFIDLAGAKYRAGFDRHLVLRDAIRLRVHADAPGDVGLMFGTIGQPQQALTLNAAQAAALGAELINAACWVHQQQQRAADEAAEPIPTPEVSDSGFGEFEAAGGRL